jgi:hypothetical protein
MSVVSLVAVSQSNIKEELIEQVTQEYRARNIPEQTLDIHIRILSEVCDEVIPELDKKISTYENLRAQYKGVNTKQQKQRFIRNHAKQISFIGLDADACLGNLPMWDKIMTTDELHDKFLTATQLKAKAHIIKTLKSRVTEEMEAEVKRMLLAGCTMKELAEVAVKYSGVSEEEARDLLMNMKLPFNQ